MTPFHDPGEFIALPRILALRLSPDGTRPVAVVQALAPDRRNYRTALWGIDPQGGFGRLTGSTAGEAQPEFLPDGSLLFVSDRPDPAADGDGGDGDGDDGPTLWHLPADGGEPREVAHWPGGVEEFAVARDTGTVAFAASVTPGATDRERRREAAGVTAVLHESHPILGPDHHLGPAERRLFITAPVPPDDDLGTPRDITPEAGRALSGQLFAITPDGATVITGWWVAQPRGERRSELVAIDTATGERRRLAAEDGVDFHSPAVAPDGRGVVCTRERHGTPDEPIDLTLWSVSIDRADGGHDLTPGLDLWPFDPIWSPDSRTVYFGAYEHGRAPVFGVDVGTKEVTRLTDDDAAYEPMAVSPDGRNVYAVRSGIGAPPAPVRLAEGEPPVRLTREESPAPPGRVTEITATAPDGVPVRSWLVLPGEASSPAPLLVWVHGGPHSSWCAWDWHWNPWVMAAHGYAVLLPDPALSGGYGQDSLRRGHGRWAAATFDDLMAITDAAVARADIDGTRTAVMGPSFGGQMTNWIAGHTDRFDAIVTHAGPWRLDDQVASDEGLHAYARVFGDPDDHPGTWAASDPARHVGKISTPMLVTHGGLDHRVPVGHALRQWTDLVRYGVEVKFVYFPDEGHRIRRPGNAAVWYATVLAFLAQHLLDEKWNRPELL